MGRMIHHRSIAGDVLKAIGAGAILVSLFVAPNIGLALAPFLRRDYPYERRAWKRQQVQAALRRLRERRYVRYEERGKETYILITEFGKQRLRRFEFETLAMPEQLRRWDKKWRIVAFDIPEKKQRERKALRDKLNDLGFFALQESVFVYPHPCEDEVNFLCKFLGIDGYVYCIEATHLGNAEGKVRRHFNLP